MVIFDKQALLSNFSSEDRLFFSKILETAEKSVYRHTATFSDFVDPHRTGIIIDLFKRVSDEERLTVRAYGGAFVCERAVIGFCPSYLYGDTELDGEHFPIARIKISYDSKFAKSLTHRDFLGAVMGLSIGREKIGDIIVQDGYTYLLVKSEISSFIIQNLFMVGNAAVSCEEADYMEINSAVDDSKPMSTAVASARLDGIVAHCFHVSRTEASEAVRRDKIYVNWAVSKDSSQKINSGDTISFRGVGRIKITSLSERTSRGRYFVEYLAYF